MNSPQLPLVKEEARPKSTDEHIENLEKRLVSLVPSEKDTTEESSVVKPKKDRNALLIRIKLQQEKVRKQKVEAERRKEEEEEMLAALEKEEEEILAELENETNSCEEEEVLAEVKKEGSMLSEFLKDEHEELAELAEDTTISVEEEFETYNAEETMMPSPSAPSHDQLEADFSLLYPQEDTQESSYSVQESSYNVEAVGSITPPHAVEQSTESIVLDEDNATLVEEQRQILAEIQRQQSVKKSNAESLCEVRSETTVARSAAPSRTVEISSGHRVPLHGQEKTREAIAKGTAILVQCVSCQNWMQVTHTAKLMFCPMCSVVSPVQKQNQVMTKEDAVRMTHDRKMAESLQNQEWMDQKEEEMKNEGSWFGARSDTTTWAEWLGISAKQESKEENTTSASRMYDVQTGEENGVEMEHLAGRVAERKPLFSCVVESVSTVANTLRAAAGGPSDENTHGISTEPLISVTTVGRQKNENNEYTSLTLNEE